MSLIAHGIIEHRAAVLITIQLPDGSFAKKPIEDLQPEDMVVFDGCETRQIEYRPQPMVWDFD